MIIIYKNDVFEINFYTANNCQSPDKYLGPHHSQFTFN